MKKILDLGLYFGLNGCSLRSNEHLEIVKKIPLDRIMIETDAPCCGIGPTHASKKYVRTHIDHVHLKGDWAPGMTVKKRNEPCKMIQNCEVIATIKGVTEEELASVAYENSCKVFVRE